MEEKEVFGHDKGSIIEYATRIALSIGLIWALSFLAMMGGLRENPGLGFVGDLLVIYSLFSLQRLTFHYRKANPETTFGKMFKLTWTTCLLASLIVSITQYFWFAYADNGMFINAMLTALQDDQVMGVFKKSAMTKDQITEVISNFTVKDLVAQFMWMHFFVSILLSWLIARINMRKRLTRNTL